MEKNEKILLSYEKQIAGYPHLKFKDAVPLYKKIKETDDKNLQKSYMDELIIGTLYIIPKYIRETNILMFCNQNYDAWDIINAFNETWIRKIRADALLKYVNFSSIINCRCFFNEVYKSLGGNLFGKPDDLNEDTLVNLLTKYLILKDSAQRVCFQDLITTELQEKGILNEEEAGLYYKYASEFYYEFAKQYSWRLIEKLFLNVYNNTKELSKENLQKQKLYIKKILPFIINMGIEEPLNLNWLSDCDIEFLAQKKYAKEAFIQMIEEMAKVYGKSGQRAKQIIIMRFGLDGKGCMTQEEIGKILNISSRYISQIEGKALRVFKNHRVLIKANSYYFYSEK